MDHELAEALERTSDGRLRWVFQERTLHYSAVSGARSRLLSDARELRSLMQLLVLGDSPRPGGSSSLEVGAQLLLERLDARPDLAARSIPHVRAAVASAFPRPVRASGADISSLRPAADSVRPTPYPSASVTSIVSRNRAS